MAFVRLTVLGCIPPNTPCPYANECYAAHNHACFHRGIEHDNEHDCHIAKVMDYLRPEEVHEQIILEIY